MLTEAKKRAKELLQDKQALRQLLSLTDAKLAKHRASISKVYEEASCLVRLLRAWISREYSEVEAQSVVMILGALIYFLNPLDLIPDFLVGGFVDDAMVLSGVLSVLHHELSKFKSWESGKVVGGPS